MQTRTISRLLGLGGLLALCSACGADSQEPSSDGPSNGSGDAPSQARGGSSSGGSSSGGETSTDAGTSSGGSATAGTSSSSAGTASGGSPSSGDACAPDPSACTAASAMEKMALADFENGMGWYLFANPADTEAITEPAAGGNIPAAEITCPSSGLCGSSSFAMHVSGSGFTEYGPSLSNDWVYQDDMMMVVGEPLDASAYTGVAFWARKGDTAGAAPTLRLIVNDVNTHAQGGVCDPEAAPGSGGEASEACWDGWMTERAMPSSWTLIKVPFSVLAQGGFGKPAEAIDTSKIYGITFQMPNMADFDFWIDDVAFYAE